VVKKDELYRLMQNQHLNWEGLTKEASLKAHKEIYDHIDEKDACFVIDDSPINRDRSDKKSTEMIRTQYDHVSHTFFTGFLDLTLGWTDGQSFFPVESRMMSGQVDEEETEEASENNDGQSEGKKKRGRPRK